MFGRAVVTSSVICNSFQNLICMSVMPRVEWFISFDICIWNLEFRSSTHFSTKEGLIITRQSRVVEETVNQPATHKSLATFSHTPSIILIQVSMGFGNLFVQIPHTNLKRFYDRALSAYAPRLWNELPDNIKAADSVPNFKKHLKTLLFRKEFIWLYGP